METRADSTPARQGSRWLWVTFLALAVVYFLTANGRVSISDSAAMLQVTRSILEGRLNVVPDVAFARGPDGLSYCHYGLLVSLWWIPFVLAGRIAAPLAPEIEITQWEEAAVSFSGMFVVLGLLGYLAWEWRRQGASDRRIAVGIGLIGLGTILWPYSKNSTSDPVMTLGLIAAYAHGRRAVGLQSRHWLWCGIWMGVAFLSRKAALTLLPLLALQLGYRMLTQLQGNIRWSALWRIAAGYAPFLLAKLWYNWARWGGPMTDIYGGDAGSQWFSFEPVSLAISTWRLLFGDYVGFFIFNPVLLPMLAWGLRRWWRFDRESCLLALALLLSQLAFYAGYSYNHGRFTFGSRFLLPLIPFLALGWPVWDGLMRGGRLFLSLSFAAGLCVQALGVATDPLAALCRREFYLTPSTPILVAHYEELMRALGRRPDPPPPSADPLREPYWEHAAFREPDLWWWHLAAARKHSARPAGRNP